MPPNFLMKWSVILKMIWTIIGIIILSGFYRLYEKGKQREKQAKEKEKIRKQIEETQNEIKRQIEIKEENYKNSIIANPNKLENEWNTRIKQLNIDLNKAVRVEFCWKFTNDTYNTNDLMNVYIWDVDGAIAMFRDYRQNGLTWTQSPLEWPIYYFKLKNIEGVYERNTHTLIQYNDGSTNAFALKDCNKVKEVYRKAKMRTI